MRYTAPRTSLIQQATYKAASVSTRENGSVRVSRIQGNMRQAYL